MTAVMEKIKFGTDGFRGLIGDNFNYETVRKIAQGFSDYLAYKGYDKTKIKIVVGYDRRFLSDRFAKEFTTVLVNNDIDCVLSKTPVTTPTVSYLTTCGYDFGIMITASHNNYIYNGIKIKYQGRSALPSFTAELELYIEKNKKLHISRIPKKNIVEKDLIEEYVKYLNKRFNISKIISTLKGRIVFDFMYGTGADVFERLFGKYKNVIAVNTEHDPIFGDIKAPEPVESKLEALKEAVKKNKAVCGFALDGDGDRFALVDGNGNYMTPCQVAPMILDYLIDYKKMSGKVVQAVSLGFLTQRIARQKNMIFEFTPVGFKYLADRIIDGDTIFGAEESGGYCWKGNIPDRDGFVTSLLFMEMMAETKKSISQIYKEVEEKYGSSYFVREDFHTDKNIPSKYAFSMKLKSKLPKEILKYKVREVVTLDGLKVILENDWWFLVRPSGTEPLIRVYVETDSQKHSKDLMKFVKDVSLSNF